MIATCPNCCFDLSPFEPIVRGDLSIPDRVTFRWQGHDLQLTPQQRLILLAIIRADGEIVKRTALMEAIGLDTDDRDPSNSADVQLSRVRAAFREIDPLFDSIETVRGEGLRWRA